MEIYFFDTKEVTGLDIKRGYSMLDTPKKARVDNCNNEKRKREIIVSDLLTRTMLSQRLNIKPKELTFAHSSHGKPILTNLEINFNVSHSGDYWVGCVDSSPCGIDIEVVREVKLNSANKFCNEEELEYITNHSTPQIALLEIWTKKEAYFKSIGCGIATVLSAVNVLRQDKITTKISEDFVISVYGDDRNFNIKTLQL